jgi:hypothetical protein
MKIFDRIALCGTILQYNLSSSLHAGPLTILLKETYDRWKIRSSKNTQDEFGHNLEKSLLQ